MPFIHHWGTLCTSQLHGIPVTVAIFHTQLTPFWPIFPHVLVANLLICYWSSGWFKTFKRKPCKNQRWFKWNTCKNHRWFKNKTCKTPKNQREPIGCPMDLMQKPLNLPREPLLASGCQWFRHAFGFLCLAIAEIGEVSLLVFFKSPHSWAVPKY